MAWGVGGGGGAAAAAVALCVWCVSGGVSSPSHPQQDATLQPRVTCVELMESGAVSDSRLKTQHAREGRKLLCRAQQVN